MKTNLRRIDGLWKTLLLLYLFPLTSCRYDVLTSSEFIFRIYFLFRCFRVVSHLNFKEKELDAKKLAKIENEKVYF